jgi:hypothetical protein
MTTENWMKIRAISGNHPTRPKPEESETMFASGVEYLA